MHPHTDGTVAEPGNRRGAIALRVVLGSVPSGGAVARADVLEAVSTGDPAVAPTGAAGPYSVSFAGTGRAKPSSVTAGGLAFSLTRASIHPMTCR